MKRELTNKIYTMLNKLKNVPIEIKVHKGRKRYVTFNGIIKEVYTNIFTIIPMDENKLVQSFAFSDLITKDIILIGYAQ